MVVRTRPASVFVIPGSHPGLLKRGNIDLTKRPVVRNPDGSISTVRSISFGITFKGRNAEVLVPTVVGNRVVSDDQAFRHFRQTGAFLGIFDTPAHATQYALKLHKWQAAYYRKFLKP